MSSPSFDLDLITGLTATSQNIRKRILESVYLAGKGHVGGALSIVELLSALYFSGLFRFLPKDGDSSSGDRLILSKGHAGVGLYAALTEAGRIQPVEMTRLNSGHLLAEHPSPNIPGVDFVSGSLGHGLSVGAGFALADKIDNSMLKTVVLLGDGECYEGSVWEAAQFAGHHKLSTLLAIVDRNGLITHGSTEDINAFGDLSSRWRSYGWEAVELDGHSFPEIIRALDAFAAGENLGPLAIIAKTVKGKGVRSLEGAAGSHHGSISLEQLNVAIREMRF